jgi:hypothetical protein
MTFGVADVREAAGEAATGVRLADTGVDFEVAAVREGVGVRPGCGTRDADAGVVGVRVAAVVRSRLGVRLTGVGLAAAAAAAAVGADFAAAVGVERERSGEAGFFTTGEATFAADSLLPTGDGLVAAVGLAAGEGVDFAAAGRGAAVVPTGRVADPVLVVERTDEVLSREEEAVAAVAPAAVEVVLEPGTREREEERTGAGLAGAAAGLEGAAFAAAGFDAVEA